MIINSPDPKLSSSYRAGSCSASYARDKMRILFAMRLMLSVGTQVVVSQNFMTHREGVAHSHQAPIQYRHFYLYS